MSLFSWWSNFFSTISKKISVFIFDTWSSLLAQMVKNLPAMKETLKFDPRVRTIPWRREWQPMPVFLPGEFHGQSSLVSYSSWSCKKLTRANNTHTHTHTHTSYFKVAISWVSLWYKKHAISPFQKYFCLMLFSFYLCCLIRMIWNLDSNKGIQGWTLHKGATKKPTWSRLSSSLAQRDHLLTKLCISRFASVQNEKPFSVCRNIPFPRVSGLVVKFTGVTCR